MLIISLCDGSAVCVGQYNLFNKEAQQIDGIFFILLFLQSIKYNGKQAKRLLVVDLRSVQRRNFFVNTEQCYSLVDFWWFL